MDIYTLTIGQNVIVDVNQQCYLSKVIRHKKSFIPSAKKIKAKCEATVFKLGRNRNSEVLHIRLRKSDYLMFKSAKVLCD